MGLSAVQAGPGSTPQVGDGVIRGYLVSVQGGGTGSMVQRFVIGFGAGTSEMDTVVEGYAVTPQGWRKLGSGTLTSSGNKTPGMIVPAAVAIATANPIGLIVVAGRKSMVRLAAEADSRAEPRRPPTQLRSSSKSDSRIAAGSSERRNGELLSNVVCRRVMI